LANIKKKFIFNISSISENKLKTIGLNNYLSWLCMKLKNEVEEGIYFLNKKIMVKCFMLGVLGDNKEIYQLLCLKGNFGKGNFRCRCCDINSNNLNENEKNVIMDNKQ
jgi:hypothetical protein